MIPNDIDYEEEEDIESDFELESEPSKTYAMNLDNSIFTGKIDETEAIKQAILKMINTERYQHEIYSWDYGIELADLYGKPFDFVRCEIENRIRDALMADDRIEDVGEFEVERIGKRELLVKFTVKTVNDDELDMESEVEV